MHFSERTYQRNEMVSISTFITTSSPGAHSTRKIKWRCLNNMYFLHMAAYTLIWENGTFSEAVGGMVQCICLHAGMWKINRLVPASSRPPHNFTTSHLITSAASYYCDHNNSFSFPLASMRRQKQHRLTCYPNLLKKPCAFSSYERDEALKICFWEVCCHEKFQFLCHFFQSTPKKIL